jgi:hypothetical protein
LSYRYLPVEMATHPWVFGPLLALVLASVVLHYVRTTRRWDLKPAAEPPLEPRTAELQPELV